MFKIWPRVFWFVSNEQDAANSSAVVGMNSRQPHPTDLPLPATPNTSAYLEFNRRMWEKQIPSGPIHVWRPDSAQASARGPKEGRILMGGYFWREAVSSPNSLVGLVAHVVAVVTTLLSSLDVQDGSQRPGSRVRNRDQT
jgi:hypothetical protein